MSALPSAEYVSLVVDQPLFSSLVAQPVDSAPAALFTEPVVRVLTFSVYGGRDGAQGNDGAAGTDATVHARRSESTGSLIYAATAPAGSAESAAVWRITRLTYTSGALTATGVATGVTWTGRAGHTYT